MSLVIGSTTRPWTSLLAAAVPELLVAGKTPRGHLRDPVRTKPHWEEASMKSWRLAVAALCLLLAGMSSATTAGESLPQPSGPVVLEVSGDIDNLNADGVARFDRQMLEALGTKKLKTSTAWTTGVSEFEGVLARDLLDNVGASGTTVTASALNDYTVSIPIDELRRYPVMLALKMDGEYLLPKDKGPIWIIYPRDQNRELQDSMIDKRWIWQLNKIRID